MDICAYNVFRMYVYGSSTPNISGYPQASSSSVAAQVLTVFTVRKARLNFWSVCPLPALYCAPQMHWLPTWRNHCSRPQKISQNFIKECIRGLPVLLGLQGPWGDAVCSACMVGVNVKDEWNLNVSWRFLYGRDSATMPLAQLRTQTMCVKNLRISWTGAYFLGVVKNHTGIVKPVRSTLLACEFLFWKAPSSDQKKQFILRGQKPVRTVSWQDETERYIRLRPGAFVLRTWNAFVSFLLGYAWLVLLLESNQVETHVTAQLVACCLPICQRKRRRSFLAQRMQNCLQDPILKSYLDLRITWPATVALVHGFEQGRNRLCWLRQGSTDAAMDNALACLSCLTFQRVERSKRASITTGTAPSASRKTVINVARAWYTVKNCQLSR